MRAAHRAEPPHAPRASRVPHHAEPRTSRLKLAVLRKGVDALRTPERHPARIRAAGRGERGPSPKEGRREREQARESGSLHAQHGHDGVGRRGLARGARRARSEAAPGPLSARRDGGLFRFTREKIPWIPEVLKVSGTAEHKTYPCFITREPKLSIDNTSFPIGKTARTTHAENLLSQSFI